MDSSDLPMDGKSSRPRLAPLKVRRDSNAIKKRPVVPPAPPQYRRPIIIYAVSPKVVHATPSDFMSVVQRLTGAASASSSSSSDASVLSASARLATHASSSEMLMTGEQDLSDDLLGVDGDMVFSRSSFNGLSQDISGNKGVMGISSFSPSPNHSAAAAAAYWEFWLLQQHDGGRI
ncbi:unnamed protein product [Musa acuminata subsp. malaccensis]|uniref:(wild Malaysian banana) hypothetical protein n=1 Tax=Musa acuminata subsp. malaccensis TaxID=214687 RepID=A0A804JIJ0_MUSAM|nr:PREDICTED: uncharacterized protein LOC103988511 [Musa acuminata subsp. malaccensis]CAG1846880.1 unnamed protein product [Musa acuminata subsp. malaccensis]